MKAISTGDLHFTDKAVDSYRWGLFPWLEQQIDEHKPDYLFLGGDHTDAKDKHSAALVNHFVDAVISLSKKVHVICLRGNHDYIEVSNPYFKFLDHSDNITFIIEPTVFNLNNEKILCLPNTRQPEVDWVDYIPKFNSYDYIFLHQTFTGAISESGRTLEGIDVHIFDDTKATVISSDIHVPQKIGNVTYAGSPYRIHFGDKFNPRVLLIDNHNLIDLHFETVKRFTCDITDIKELQKLEAVKGDQIKVRFYLDEANIVEMDNLKQEIKEFCTKKGIELNDIKFPKKESVAFTKSDSKLAILTPEELLKKYCETLTDIDDTVKQTGHSVLKALL